MHYINAVNNLIIWYKLHNINSVTMCCIKIAYKQKNAYGTKSEKLKVPYKSYIYTK